MQQAAELTPGQRISHTELGQGVIVEAPATVMSAHFSQGENDVFLFRLFGRSDHAPNASLAQLTGAKSGFERRGLPIRGMPCR